jgi:carboxyl-terminal processing protease
MMKRKFRYAIWALPLFIGLTAYTFLGSRCAAAPATEEIDKNREEAILDICIRTLKSSHYRPVTIDDAYSNKVFNIYLERMDFAKRFLLKSDVEELKTKYYNDIDDQVNSLTFTFFDRSSEIAVQRVGESKTYCEEHLAKAFDFSIKESVQLDPEKLEYAANATELKEYWRKYLKYQVMVRFVEMKKDQDKAAKENKPDFKSKADTTMERESRMKVKKIFDDYFVRLGKLDRDDRMVDYINSVVGIYDPHTDFFAPKDKANFDISMSGQLEGIGATLQEKDDYIRVASIVPGSPCWKQGQLKVDDLIMKVAQGDKEPVDIANMRVDDVVKLVRGKKGTEVRLTVKHPDGSIVVIPIIRDVVILEETFAQSAIIEQDKKKVGYIRLPSFYADFTKDKSAGHFCSQDVKTELEKLKAEKVSGVVLDLRDNGGGSLFEVVKMMGLFIEDGPVVQVKTRENGNNIYTDDDHKEIVYSGPLVVLINENSASASEILAAAIQDYKRGLVVGSSPSSFGKGTVQNFFDLDRFPHQKVTNDMKPLGSLKLTIQKFYRVNGGSTQLKGVVPDIELPGFYSFDPRGEKDLDYPLEWDQIASGNYTLWTKAPEYDKLKKSSTDRVSNSPYFGLIQKKSDQLKRERDETNESLYLPDYESYRAKIDEENKAFKPLEESLKGMNVIMLSVDKKALGSDSTKIARKTDFINKLKKDPYVSEAGFMIKEMK